MGRNCRAVSANAQPAVNTRARYNVRHLLTRDKAFLIAVNIAKLPSVPRQIF
jgi:hypothetical protein